MSSISAERGLEGGKGILVPRRFVALEGIFELAPVRGPLAAMLSWAVPRRLELFCPDELLEGVTGIFKYHTLYYAHLEVIS